MNNKIQKAVELLNATGNILLAVAGLIGAIVVLRKALLPEKDENEA